MNGNLRQPQQPQSDETVFESTNALLVVMDDDQADYTVRPMREVLRKHLESRGIFPTKPLAGEKKDQG